MSVVFQNIDPPPHHRLASHCVPPAFGAGEDTLAVWRGGLGVNILEDTRHCSVLYILKYFVNCKVYLNQQLTDNVSIGWGDVRKNAMYIYGE
jgi:hypothetical protein